jgi:WXXGXW repeat (2 copies)
VKHIWTCGLGLFVAAILAVPASAQVSVYIGTTPSPMRVELPPPPPPAPEFVWVEGYWAPQGRHYRWVAGHYERPPYQGAYWCHPHYDRYPQGWEYHEGYWDREDHEHGHGHAYGHYKDRGDDDDQSRGHHKDHD